MHQAHSADDRLCHRPPLCARSVHCTGSRWQCALTELDLSQASSDAGATRLSRALHSNKSLTSLTLNLNRISTTAGLAFAEALRANATLTHASLAGNLLNDAAVRRAGETDPQTPLISFAPPPL